MNALTPFERLDDMFPEMFRRFMRPVKGSSLSTEALGEIRVDLSETDKSYEVSAELPGAKKEDIRVTIDGNYVSISAEVKRESEEEKKKKGERTVVKELFYGSASRGFSLPHEVDEKASVAKFENGILKLSLPKKQEASSRTLNIQ
ncbi:MAG: Hsp20/alpha crystallin family protein [Burkholderiaceae bacterium]|nr:Hsp20/alpha crystallin family protein [Burkholderiaceae bacterium]